MRILVRKYLALHVLRALHVGVVQGPQLTHRHLHLNRRHKKVAGGVGEDGAGGHSTGHVLHRLQRCAHDVCVGEGRVE